MTPLRSLGNPDISPYDDIFCATGKAYNVPNITSYNKAVDFDGSGDTLFAPNSSDYYFGSGDFTVEGWFKIDQQSSQNGIIGVWAYSVNRRSWLIQTDNSSNGPLEFFISPDGGNGSLSSASGGNVSTGTWYHFAGVRTGNTLKLFLAGSEVASSSFSGSPYNNTQDDLHIGSVFDQTDFSDAQISNIRVTKGEALYTSAFTPATSPLETTSQGATESNVKLLCCNQLTVTGATVSSGTMTTSGDPTLTTGPF